MNSTLSPAGNGVLPPPRKTLVGGVADMAVSNDPGAELVTYSLGSCLGITIYDPLKKIGGLLHLMLPDSNIDSAKALTMPHMFVDTGVPRLFHAAYHLGADCARLIIKIAGGAQLLDTSNIFNIGARRVKAAMSARLNHVRPPPERRRHHRPGRPEIILRNSSSSSAPPPAARRP